MQVAFYCEKVGLDSVAVFKTYQGVQVAFYCEGGVNMKVYFVTDSDDKRKLHDF